MTFRLPNDTQHIAVIGKNGTGKTQSALWLLSKRPFDKRPELIVDFKRDDHIAGIEEAIEIPVGEVPTEPGIFVVRPNVADLASNETAMPFYNTLAGAYDKENIGIWFDEAFVLGKNKKVEGMFENLLTQGRSKRIPLIILVQRPVWVSRFVMSESSYFQLFRLQDKRDAITLQEVMPESAFYRVPDYHSAYYDVNRDKVDFLAPVPAESEILKRINTRLIEIRNRARDRNKPRFL
jgi:hypothetical protein